MYSLVELENLSRRRHADASAKVIPGYHQAFQLKVLGGCTGRSNRAGQGFVTLDPTGLVSFHMALASSAELHREMTKQAQACFAVWTSQGCSSLSSTPMHVTTSLNYWFTTGQVRLEGREDIIARPPRELVQMNIVCSWRRGVVNVNRLRRNPDDVRGPPSSVGYSAADEKGLPKLTEAATAALPSFGYREDAAQAKFFYGGCTKDADHHPSGQCCPNCTHPGGDGPCRVSSPVARMDAGVPLTDSERAAAAELYALLSDEIVAEYKRARAAASVKGSQGQVTGTDDLD